MRFLSILTIFLCLNFKAYACALCSLYTANVELAVNFIQDNDKITKISTNWHFHKQFSEALLQGYDTNGDQKLDVSELNVIRQSLLDYIVPNNFLLNLSYYYEDEIKTQQVPLTLETSSLNFENNRLNFIADFKLDIAVKKGLVISIEAKDSGGFFNFKFLNHEKIELKNHLMLLPNANSDVIFFKAEIPQKQQPVKENSKEKSKSVSAQESNQNQFGISFLNTLKQELVKSSKEQTPTSLLFIAFFSFMYALLHALAPGHAKVISASYFVASNSSYKRAFLFGIKVGLMHVILAFLFVVFMFFILQNTSIFALKDTNKLATTLSATLIIAISSFMLYRKIIGLIKQKKGIAWHSQDCSCGCHNIINTSHKKKNEWAVIIASSLMPCPGIFLVFILSFELGSFLSAFISAISMAFGMSIVVFLSAILGAKINTDIFQKTKKLKLFGEFLALFAMIGYGLSILILGR